MKNLGSKIKHCKERGEWAELCFMARAAEQGLKVSKPYGDSASYDVGVECNGRILRVQVKSTIYHRRNGEYSLNVMGPQRERYAAGTVDFFAVYLIPIDAWYIIPFELTGRSNLSLHFTPQSKRHKYARYREAWHLLVEAAQMPTRSGGKLHKPDRRCENCFYGPNHVGDIQGVAESCYSEHRCAAAHWLEDPLGV